MSFQSEFARIPALAKTLAVIVFACALILFWRVVGPQEPLDKADIIPFSVIVVLMPAFFAAYVLMVGYIYADAKRRNMRHVMWTFLAALVPNAIGMILYFIMRDALPTACLGCTRAVPGGFPFCPHCGFALAPRCPKCSAAVKHDWANCPFCGTGLKAAPFLKPDTL